MFNNSQSITTEASHSHSQSLRKLRGSKPFKCIYIGLVIGFSKRHRAREWTQEHNQKLFLLYKEMGAHWSKFTKHFHGLTENQIKNKFYSTLRRVATAKTKGKQIKMRKEYLVQFVDDAILHGHNYRLKRGRKPKHLKHIIDVDQLLDIPTLEEEKVLNKGSLNNEELKQEKLNKESIEYKNSPEEVYEDIKENHERINCMYDSGSEDYHEMQLNLCAYSNYRFIDPYFIHLLIKQNTEALEILERESNQEINDPGYLLEVLDNTKTKLRETQIVIKELYDICC